ncbi:MAG: hypothetical protein VKP62_16105 [Candidatus Sericytochromatia bacterium]|nr:hypothetical protein [Candidatus Sericytochromatia bacterium]
MTKLLAFSTCLACLATSWVAVTPEVRASTQPAADWGTASRLGLAGGQSVGLSYDVPVAPHLTLGAGIGSRAFVGARVEVRTLLRLAGNPVDAPYHLALVGGLQAAGPAFGNLESVAPMVGLASAFHFGLHWSVRFNLAGAYTALEPWRASGIEVAYRHRPGLEWTFGLNGRGDVLGLKVLL